MEQIREHMNAGALRDQAITASVKHCIEKGVLADFLEKHYREVCDMLTWECTFEDELEIKKEEGIEEGIKEGLIIAAIKFIEKGMSLQDVADTLKLTDVQIGELKKSII